MIITKKSKYIVIIVSFLIITFLSIVIPLTYIQLFAVPTMLLIIYRLLKSEISYHPEQMNKQILQLASQAFFTCLFSQTVLNLISMRVVNAEDVGFSAVIPIIPVYTVLFAPVVEEVLFRYIVFGFLQGSKEKFSIMAAIISSTFFGIIHMNVTLFLGYFAVGFVLCYFYHKSKNLIVPILAHIMLNFFALFSQSIHLVFGGQYGSI